MKGILLVNMGAPDSLGDMKTFLKRMFRDKNIIPLPKALRNIISIVISNVRYKKSWAKYQLIGGSPLKKSCEAIAIALAHKTGMKTYIGYSFSNPFLENTLKEMQNNGIDEIVVLSMFPQNSYSTTRSVQQDIEKYMPQNLHYSIVKEYYSEPLFIDFWVKQINKTIHKTGVKQPLLLFSAHSVPQYHIDQGDNYEKAIRHSAQLIAKAMNLRFEVSFQSKIGKMKWVEPDTISTLTRLKGEGVQEILIIPISFLTENLETLYDIDTEIIPQFKTAYKAIHKVSMEDSTDDIIPLFHNLVVN
jgi:ferrochelatase